MALASSEHSTAPVVKYATPAERVYRRTAAVKVVTTLDVCRIGFSTSYRLKETEAGMYFVEKFEPYWQSISMPCVHVDCKLPSLFTLVVLYKMVRYCACQPNRLGQEANKRKGKLFEQSKM
jgi:hypothetical protein